MKHESETAARAVHARGTNPYGLEYPLPRVGSRRCKHEHDIYDDDAIRDSQSDERILGRSISRPCGVIIPVSRPASRSSGFSETGSLDHGIHNHLPGATGTHGEYYGVPQRQGRQQNTVFPRSLRAASLAEAMGSADGARPH